MKEGASKRLTREQRAELKSLAALRDDAIDTSDAPELLDWSGAKRGLFYRPVKQQLTLRLDADATRSPMRDIKHALIERCVSTCAGRQAGAGALGHENADARHLQIPRRREDSA
jgi:hypothetical protein